MVAAETEPRRWALLVISYVEGEIFHLSESEPEGALATPTSGKYSVCMQTTRLLLCWYRLCVRPCGGGGSLVGLEFLYGESFRVARAFVCAASHKPTALEFSWVLRRVLHP